VTAIGVSAGAVVGLVGITPGCGYVTVGAALIMGMVTASFCNFTMHYIKTITPVDDTLDVFAGHGMGGLIGMILTSLFAHPDLAVDDEIGLFYGDAVLFWHTLVVAALVILFSCVMTVLLYYVVNALIKFRVSEAKEREGLDSSVHGEVVHGFVKPAGFSMDDSRTAG
jgi:ammonium transporter, Amt family